MITVYGPGAGAAAAGLLAIAPSSRHMVRQVFGQVRAQLSNTCSFKNSCITS
jgi:hypothetical protein